MDYIEFELEQRFPKDLTKEDSEYIKEQRLLDPEFDVEDFLESVREYEYEPVTINLTQVGPYSRIDDEHTLIRIVDAGIVFVGRINYSKFQSIREASLGIVTRKESDFMSKPTKVK